MLHQTMQLISPLVKGKVDLLMDVDDNIPDVLGDEDRIIQVGCQGRKPGVGK